MMDTEKWVEARFDPILASNMPATLPANVYTAAVEVADHARYYKVRTYR